MAAGDPFWGDSGSLGQHATHDIRPPAGEEWQIRLYFCANHVGDFDTILTDGVSSVVIHSASVGAGGGFGQRRFSITRDHWLRIQNQNAASRTLYYHGIILKDGDGEIARAIAGITDPYGVDEIRPAAGTEYLIAHAGGMNVRDGTGDIGYAYLGEFNNEGLTPFHVTNSLWLGAANTARAYSGIILKSS